MKYYRVKLTGRDDWQEWTIPDDATYSTYHGWDYLHWWQGDTNNRVWIRHEQVQAIQFREEQAS